MCDSITKAGTKCTRMAKVGNQCLQHSKSKDQIDKKPKEPKQTDKKPKEPKQTYKKPKEPKQTDKKPKELKQTDKKQKLLNKVTLKELQTIFKSLYKDYALYLESLSEYKSFNSDEIHKDILKELNKNNLNSDILLNIKVSKTDKIIGIGGPGMFILRRMKDMDKDYDRYYPDNYYSYKKKTHTTSDCYITGYKEPLWNRTHGYMYVRKQHINIIRLNFFISCVNTINKKNLTIVNPEDTNELEGIIGIDVKYDEPEWVTQLTTFNNKPPNVSANPIVKGNIIYFGINGVSISCINKSLSSLSNKYFENLYPVCIHGYNKSKSDIDILLSNLNDFFKSDTYKVALISYSKHSRVIFRNNTTFTIIDPWKQKADRITSQLIKKCNINFISREKEQGREGSCVVNSFARALYLSHMGIDNIDKVIPFDYVIISFRLITKFRHSK